VQWLHSHPSAFNKEAPVDKVFTVEYSVRAAQMAVYELLRTELKVSAVTPHDKSMQAEFEVLIKAFK
jgi:oleate hydratase